MRRSAPEAGFTLVELAVVLAILALLAGLVLPPLASSLAQTTQRAAIAELRVALRQAGAEAIATGNTVVFRAGSDGSYWVGAEHRVLAGDAARRPRVAVAGTGRISFYPWGGSSGGRVSIEGAQGRREIAVDPVSGRAVASR